MSESQRERFIALEAFTSLTGDQPHGSSSRIEHMAGVDEVILHTGRLLHEGSCREDVG